MSQNYVLRLIEYDPEPVDALQRAARLGAWAASAFLALLRSRLLRFRQSDDLVPLLIRLNTALAAVPIVLLLLVIRRRGALRLFRKLNGQCRVCRDHRIEIRQERRIRAPRVTVVDVHTQWTALTHTTGDGLDLRLDVRL